jgi:hypothetical protein
MPHSLIVVKMQMNLKPLKFKRKLSRGAYDKSAISVAVPKLFLELMEAEHCQYVWVSIEDKNHLRLEVIRE